MEMETFPGQVILRNVHVLVHNVCKYQLQRPSHTTMYGASTDVCLYRPAVSIWGLFGKACSPIMGKA